MSSSRLLSFELLALLSIAVFSTPTRGQVVGRLVDNSAAGNSQSALSPAGKELAGKWIYRSFISAPNLSDETKPLDQLLFGQGNLKIDVDDSGKVTGTLGGEGWELKLKGVAQAGDPVTVKFQGSGIIGGETWVYDYIGYAVPKWPKGIDQRPAIVGTIIRTVPHSGGKAQAGYVAQWIAVREFDEDEVRQLENGWADAVRANDADRIDRYFADGFSFVDPNTNVQTREQHLDDFRTGKLKVVRLTIRNIKIELHETTAKVTTRASVEGSYDGHDIVGDYDFQDTWLLVQGRLRAIVRKQTRVKKEESTDTTAIDRETSSLARAQTVLNPKAPDRSAIARLNATLAGKTSVLLFVKGSFCPHCMTQVSTMADKLSGRNVNVFVISASAEDDLKGFPPASYHLIADPNLDVFKAYGAFDGEAKHATIVLAGNGKELFRDVDNEPLLNTAPVIRAIELSANPSAVSLQ